MTVMCTTPDEHFYLLTTDRDERTRIVIIVQYPRGMQDHSTDPRVVQDSYIDNFRHKGHAIHGLVKFYQVALL